MAHARQEENMGPDDTAIELSAKEAGHPQPASRTLKTKRGHAERLLGFDQ